MIDIRFPPSTPSPPLLSPPVFHFYASSFQLAARRPSIESGLAEPSAHTSTTAAAPPVGSPLAANARSATAAAPITIVPITIPSTKTGTLPKEERRHSLR